MHAHLLHALVKDPHTAAIPAYPHLPANELGRCFVISPLYFHVTVPMHATACFLKAGKKPSRQRLQLGAFLFKAGSHLRARRAVDPLVGDAAAAFPMLVIKMIADCGVISTGFELPANRCDLSPLTGMISVPGRRWL
jgi:hypothetical protein